MGVSWRNDLSKRPMCTAAGAFVLVYWALDIVLFEQPLFGCGSRSVWAGNAAASTTPTPSMFRSIYEC